LTSERKLIASRYALHHDILRLDTPLLELPDRPLDKRLDDYFVPSRVNYGNPEGGTVIALRRRWETFDRRVRHGALIYG